MKKILSYGIIAALGLSMASCDDFINENRYPMSMQVVNASFWNNSVNVQNQLNYFYESFLGYGNATGYGDFYFNTQTDDQVGTVGGNFADWRVQNVPDASSSWNSPYTEIRRANNVIVNVEAPSNTLSAAEKANFIGIAKMMRAYHYYLLVRRYGDVPLILQPLDPSSPELYKRRDKRADVIDQAKADLQDAIKGITAKNGKQVFSQDLARAILMDVALFEGSYQRYVAKNEGRAKEYFTIAAEQAADLVAKYPVGNDYRALYTTLNGGLTKNPEVLLCKTYIQGSFMHSTVDYTSGSTPIAGISRDAFESYLMIDGTPMSKADDKKDAGEMEGDRLSLKNVIEARDKRLGYTIYPYVFFENYAWKNGINTADMTSTTGYGVYKYNNTSISLADATSANKNYTDCPLYWGAEFGLALAEAKAELGTLTDGDITTALGKVYERAGLPVPTVASLSAINDPANNMDVSSLIWEIRRCRRCELIMDNDIRYWDLIRWNQLEKMDTQKYPKTVQGANLKNYTGAVKFAQDGDYMNAPAQLFANKQRVYNAKYNLYPIPARQISLANDVANAEGEFTQNPGWN